ncbi:MAG TPA: nucleoside monophosphate kinase [Patescibacteria group bacterium]|nr:nucleoside monophosphate kinase [Patescibacteria group bacterium]
MIVFMGAAGSGKSVQGRMLADELGLPWVSTGEFLRMLVAGQDRKDMMSGKLLPDRDIIQLVRKIFNIINTDHGFVLDGFPRTLAQADWLLNQVKHGQLTITALINIQASPEVIKKRLMSRGRTDDTEESIGKRIKEYQQFVVPIIEHFEKAGVPVYEINGDQSPLAVHEKIIALVRKERKLVHPD